MSNVITKYPVPLIFKKILNEEMSGELVVTGENFARNLFFVSGRLAFATTSVEKERLGELLVSSGKINRPQLEKILHIQKDPPYQKYKIGELLVKAKLLDKQDFFWALKTQVINIAASTFRLREGEWRFVLKKPDIPNPQTFKIRLPEIIPGAVKTMEDFSYYKKKFFHRAPATAPLSEDLSRYLTPDENRLYTGLGGFSNTPVSHIIDALAFNDAGGVKEQSFWKNLTALYLLNAVEFVEYIVDEEQNQYVEEINDLYKKIKEEQPDYYRLMGIKDHASMEEVEKGYRDFTGKYHPEKIKAAPDSTLMMKAKDVYAEINKAYEMLSDRNKKKEFDGGRNIDASKVDVSKPDASKVEDGAADKVKNIRESYLRANHLYKAKHYFEAAALMEEVVKQDNSRANYYLLLGLAQSKLPTLIKQAENNLLKACGLEPWNPDPVFALGEMYRSENLVKKAEQYFKKALELNMEHTLAGQALNDLGKLLSPGKKPFSLFGKKK